MNCNETPCCHLTTKTFLQGGEKVTNKLCIDLHILVYLLLYLFKLSYDMI